MTQFAKVYACRREARAHHSSIVIRFPVGRGNEIESDRTGDQHAFECHTLPPAVLVCPNNP